ncbi:MAG: hypothetical protein LKF74_05110 [Megasphaera sp.]|jgi:hypothetical protein|nr:hypothetical protein [Megasphaera sp.]MCH4188178.1 hypothetical protein [Megasphaera sp.]MCH4217920.1 hypothetical protein [Megasphaera sp.]
MKRLWFLDNLRTFAVLLGLLCIWAGAYTVFPSQLYIRTTGHWVGFDVFYEGAVAISLAALFFISGYLGASDLRIHVIKPFFQKKWQRLGWPWLFGVLFLAPELAFLSYTSHGGTGSFLDFYGQHYWSDAFTQGPFWFLGVLLFLFLCLIGAKKWRHHILQRCAASGMTAPLVLFILVLQALLVSECLSYSGMTWFNSLYILTFQPSRMVTCLLYFLLGIYALKHRWFTANGYMPSTRWIAALVIIVPLYAVMAPYISIIGFFTAGFQPLHTLVFLASFLSLPGLLGSMAVLNKLPHPDSPTAVLLSNLSYPFYFLGPLLIENTAYFLQPLAISEGLKVLVTALLVIIYGYMLCKYALWHMPCFKKH